MVSYKIKPKQISNSEILDKDDRLVRGWGTVEVVDKDGQIIPISEVKKIILKMMDLGLPIIDNHTNKKVGKVLNYEFKQNPISGTEGLLLTYKIDKGFPLFDKVWEEIKEGKRVGLSFGGSSHKSRDMRVGGKLGEGLEDIEGYEFSSVDAPANQLALNTEINYFAKGDVKKSFGPFKNFAECVTEQKSQGKNEESAKKICGFLQARLEKQEEPNFAGFESLEECVEANIDTEQDPVGYCLEMMNKSTESFISKGIQRLNTNVSKDYFKNGGIIMSEEFNVQEALEDISKNLGTINKQGEELKVIVEELKDTVNELENVAEETTGEPKPEIQEKRRKLTKPEHGDEDEDEDEEEKKSEAKKEDTSGGEKTKLPKAVAEEVQEMKPGEGAESDKVQITEKFWDQVTKMVDDKLDKKFQKRAKFFTKSLTPRPLAGEIKKEESENKGIDFLKHDKKSSWADVREFERGIRREAVARAMEGPA